MLKTVIHFTPVAKWSGYNLYEDYFPVFGGEIKLAKAGFSSIFMGSSRSNFFEKVDFFQNF